MSVFISYLFELLAVFIRPSKSMDSEFSFEEQKIVFMCSGFVGMELLWIDQTKGSLIIG